jgi:hypothetical protein
VLRTRFISALGSAGEDVLSRAGCAELGVGVGGDTLCASIGENTAAVDSAARQLSLIALGRYFKNIGSWLENAYSFDSRELKRYVNRRICIHGYATSGSGTKLHLHGRPLRCLIQTMAQAVNHTNDADRASRSEYNFQ